MVSMKLTTREKQVKYLRYEKNYTLKEIAEELGISIGRVHQINACITRKNLVDLSYDEIVSLIDSKLQFGRPRVHEWELVAIKNCLVKYYELSKRTE